jgi:hypothetical protein
MPADLDPLSQLIGTQTAQIAGLASQITDLRSEVITNRSTSQMWREELGKNFDAIHSELRNMKHVERGIEQDKIALDAILRGIRTQITDCGDRLTEIERIILIWKTRAALIMGFAIVIGSLLSMAIKPLIDAAMSAVAG